ASVGDLDIGVVGLHTPADRARLGADLEVRAFYPLGASTGEDPVTGSLNASISPWLVRTGRITVPYVARQGAGLGRDGRVDLFRAGDHYLMLCDLPGIDPGSIDVSVDNRTLTIRAERSARSEDVEWLTRERPTGTFVRQVTVGSGLDLEHIDAGYTDGVLSL